MSRTSGHLQLADPELLAVPDDQASAAAARAVQAPRRDVYRVQAIEAKGPAAGPLARRFGSHVPLALGMALGAAGIAILAGFHDEPWQIALGMVVLGAGLPLTFATMAKVIVDTVRRQETGVATGMNTVMRTVGGVVGGQVGAALLAANTIPGTSVPSEAAFETAFWMSAVAAAAAAVFAFFALPRPGRRARAPVAVEVLE